MSDVIIIGGGAAGLMSAAVSARNGNEVTLIDSNAKLGRKIYATGNGRCNFTNLSFDSDCFRGSSPEFAYRAFRKFNNYRLIDFFEELGMLHREINGYVYPNSEQASSVVEILLAELRRLSVRTVTDEKISDIKRKGDGFLCAGADRSYEASNVIVAAGGLASPVHGSDGSIYEACRRLGHSFVTQVPALVNLKFKDKKLSSLAGVRLRCGLRLFIDGEPLYSENGEIIFNKDNISGIPVMQISRFASYAVLEKKPVSVHIDILDSYTQDEVYGLIRERIYGVYSGKKTAYETLTGLINGRLLDYMLKSAGINPEKPASRIKPSELNMLSRLFKDFVIEIKCPGDFSSAQVTAGGINTAEINDTMESKLISGLYFAGEILDIDGACGGYNLQWAFTSGYIAGMLK